MNIPSKHIIKLCYFMIKSCKKMSFSNYMNNFSKDVLSTGFFDAINPDDIMVTDYDKMRVVVKGEKDFRQFRRQSEYPTLCNMTKRGSGFIHIQYMLYKCVISYSPSEIENPLTIEEKVLQQRATEDTLSKNLFFAERSVIYAKRMIQNLKNKTIVLRSKHTVTNDEIVLLAQTCIKFYGMLVAEVNTALELSCSNILVKDVWKQFDMFLPALVVHHFMLTMVTSSEMFLKKHLTHAGMMLINDIHCALEEIEGPARHLLEEKHRALLILHTVIAEIRFSICLVDCKQVFDEADVYDSESDEQLTTSQMMLGRVEAKNVDFTVTI